MGELDELRWAVISERGREASSIKHDEAVELMHRLVAQKVHGTCVVTDTAARHLPQVKPEARPSPQPAKTNSKA
jgi:hypothetical protein